jgi:hypothetical protein
MAIAQTAALLDSSGRRARELESETEVWFQGCPNVALGAAFGSEAPEAWCATGGGAEAALAR